MNRKKIVLEVDRHWVLDCKSDFKPLPIQCFIDNIKNQFESVGEITITYNNFAECSILIDYTTDDTSEKIDTLVQNCIDEMLRVTDSVEQKSDNIYKLDICEVPYIAPEEKEEENNSADENNQNCISANPDMNQEEKTDQIRIDNISPEETIAHLIGAEEFKKLIHDINTNAQFFIDHHLEAVFRSNNYVFAVNEGFGLSTYLDLLSKTLVNNKLIPDDKYASCFELKLIDVPQEKAQLYIKNEVAQIRHHIICIDCADIAVNKQTPVLKSLLEYITTVDENKVFIFRVPFVENNRLLEIQDIIADKVNVKTISFMPLSENDLFIFAKECFSKYGYTISDDLQSDFKRLIAIEKRDGKFYGFETIKKLINNIIYLKIMSESIDTDQTINKNDLLKSVNQVDKSITLDLEDLIGMKNVKAKVNEIIAAIEFQRNQKINGVELKAPCMHMMFTGNPGVGKTTVARIVGKILHDKGLLSVGDFYEISGRDLVGRYVGETTPKTTQICRDALGSVLFIDEAYSLAADDDHHWDYGREALTALIAEMENHRDDFVVIFAGYSDDMQSLLRTNVGLKDRIAYKIEFDNYTREELFEIFINFVTGTFEYDQAFYDRSKEFFESISNEYYADKMFSNVRMVRNLYERVWSKAVTRFQMGGEEQQYCLTEMDLEKALNDSDFSALTGAAEEKARIGF